MAMSSTLFLLFQHVFVRGWPHYFTCDLLFPTLHSPAYCHCQPTGLPGGSLCLSSSLKNEMEVFTADSNHPLFTLYVHLISGSTRWRWRSDSGSQLSLPSLVPPCFSDIIPKNALHGIMEVLLAGVQHLDVLSAHLLCTFGPTVLFAWNLPDFPLFLLSRSIYPSKPFPRPPSLWQFLQSSQQDIMCPSWDIIALHV